MKSLWIWRSLRPDERCLVLEVALVVVIVCALGTTIHAILNAW